MNGTTSSINFLTTDDDASAAMEAFIGTNHHSSLFPPPPQAPALPAQFNEDTLQQRLQALIESAGENWTYAIFWQISHDFDSSTGDNTVILGWGDGYYKGEEDKEKKKNNNNTNTAEQEHRKRVIRELNSLISGGIGVSDESNDEEVTDTEWFFLVSMTQSFVNGVGLPGESFCDGDGEMRAYMVEIHPGITKIVVRTNGSSSLGLSLDELELDVWRFRLPESTRPELITVACVDGALIVTVPKNAEEEEDDDGGGDFGQGMGSGRLVLVQ